MLNYLRNLLKPKYQTLNRLEINANHIVSNFSYLQSIQPEADILPVLKSNAYGHGLKEMASILNRTKAKMVAVDSFPEAQIVYRYFKGKVLLIGEMPLDAYRYLRFSRTEMVVYNEKTLRYLSDLGQKVRLHLFINSGMNREGIKDVQSFIERNKSYLDKVRLVGVCSHLASADQDSDLNRRQLDKFLKDVEVVKQAGYNPSSIHLGNSAAAFTVSHPALTAYRTGLALYGYDPLEREGDSRPPLKPALELFSKIVSVQELKAGDKVSYNETYQAEKDEYIAVVPFGYFEGIDRRLSNKGLFLLKDTEGKKHQVKVAGRVCMNLTCLIVPPSTKVGDLVQIISPDPAAINSVSSIANLTGTIPYEVLVKLQSNIRREIVYKE